MTPALITRVTKADGTVLYQHQPDPRPALDPEVVDQVRTVLEEVVQRGTGVGARIGRPVAGKTGTGEQWRDAWFVGFTPELVTSVWVGFPDAPLGLVAAGFSLTSCDGRLAALRFVLGVGIAAPPVLDSRLARIPRT